MACTNQQSLCKGIFKGDAPELVDALIQASRMPTVAKNAIPSLIGRELVPWQADSMPCSPALEQSLEHRHSDAGSLVRKGSEQVQNKLVRRAKKSPRAYKPGSPCSPESRGGYAAGSFACPALAHAPRPEFLPMPTSGLLNRAGSRSRSPSPAKDDLNHHSPQTSFAQVLVRPVAA